MKTIGAHFVDELRSAGVQLDGLKWGPEGPTYADDYPAHERVKAQSVFDAHAPDVPPLPLAVAAKRAEINAERDRRYYGILTVDGLRYDADRESRAKITGRAAMCVAGLAPAEFIWMDADNVARSHSPSSFLDLCRVMDEQSQALHAAAWDMKNQVDALADPDEVRSFDSTRGWPA